LVRGRADGCRCVGDALPVHGALDRGGERIGGDRVVHGLAAARHEDTVFAF
jgi:hypothetical protein